MNRFSDFSIKYKLIISVMLLLLFTIISYLGFSLYISHEYRINQLITESKLKSKLVSDYTVTPLLFNDASGAEEVLKKLDSAPNIAAACIYGPDHKLFTTYVREGKEKVFSKYLNEQDESIKQIDNEIIITSPIMYNNEFYGTIVTYISTNQINDTLIDYAIILILAAFLLTLIATGITYKIQQYITGPILNLAQTAQEISLSENYAIRAQKLYSDEVGTLYDDFNTMLDKIEQRGREREEAETISKTYQSHLERLTNELEARVKNRTNELQDSLEKLQNAQSQLIESEKMSALGNLVAGVAHEVNTPLGISITAASIFKNEIKMVKELIDSNKLSKSALEHFIETISEADEILIKNLDRAALLVRNFKKISVDQSSEEIRKFELNSYILEVISTFKNELKHRPVKLITQLSGEKVHMNSFPGAISQIIVNMLQNTLLHGFNEDEEGEIIISTVLEDDSVIITFKDNGKGVKEEIREKIFEPFVTTKRNFGGTGLGLNITYNLATQHLKGNIRLDTTVEKGACFIITLPLDVTA